MVLTNYWYGRWEGLGIMGLVVVRVFFECDSLLCYCLTIEM